jgi:hypothetical protein
MAIVAGVLPPASREITCAQEQMTTEDRCTSHARLAIAVSFVAFAFYLLSFGSVFHNAADEWLMFAVTESLAKRGQADVAQVYWIGEHMGWARFGDDGHLYVKYTTFSTGQSLAGIPAYSIARLIPGAGLAQGAFLTNSIVVAVLLGMLVLTLGELGISPSISLSVAALFGAGSALWPYSQTYFGEPLLGLAYLACFYCLIRRRGRLGSGQSVASAPIPPIESSRSSGLRSQEWVNGLDAGLEPVRAKSANAVGVWTWVAGLAWAAAIVVKPTGLLLGPFVLAHLIVVTRSEPWLVRLREATAFILPAMIVGVGIIAWSTPVFGFGQGYLHVNSLSTPPLTGLWGLLLSPGRSLFVYSPVAVLALPGLYFLWRRDMALTTTLVCFLAFYILLFALWSDWYGGRTNWGPRHLVPVLPLLALGAAAFLASGPQTTFTRVLVGIIGLVGVTVQVPAIANDYLPTMIDLIDRFPAPIDEEAPAAALAFASLRGAPFLQQWLRLSLERSDLAWLNGVSGFDITALSLSLGLLALAGAHLNGVYRRQMISRTRLMPLVLAVATLLVVALLLPRYADHPHYGSSDYRQALEFFDREALPGATLITFDTGSHRAFNYQKRSDRRYGLSSGTFDPLPPQVEALLDKISRDHDEVWLLSDDDRVGTAEQRLRARLSSTDEWRWADTRLTQLRRD